MSVRAKPLGGKATEARSAETTPAEAKSGESNSLLPLTSIAEVSGPRALLSKAPLDQDISLNLMTPDFHRRTLARKHRSKFEFNRNVEPTNNQLVLSRLPTQKGRKPDPRLS